MKYCKQHGSAMEGDNFCYKCGAKLVEQEKCSCGKGLLAGIDLFCPHCGRNLSEESEEHEMLRRHEDEELRGE